LRFTGEADKDNEKNLITTWLEVDSRLRPSYYEAGKLLWNYDCWWW
jgi:hypothetical protein